METYHVGRKQISHHKRNILLVFLLVVVVAIGSVAAKIYLQPNTMKGRQNNLMKDYSRFPCPQTGCIQADKHR
jgi:hypothetical protein